jgi:hypothetical protein
MRIGFYSIAVNAVNIIVVYATNIWIVSESKCCAVHAINLREYR